MEGEEGRWPPDRVTEGTSYLGSWRDGRPAMSEAVPPRSSWTLGMFGATGWRHSRHGEKLSRNRSGAHLSAWAGYARQSAITESHSGSPAQRNVRSSPRREDNHHGDHTLTTNSRSPPLAELCAGTVALCSLYYIRLRKERRRRDAEHRRRLLLFRRFKARERLRFAVTWASALLPAGEAPTGEGETRAWNSVIERAFSRFDWVENFRMSKPTFDFLCNQLRRMEGGVPVEARARHGVPVEVRLAVTLWHLGSSSSFQTMEKIFGLPSSTICGIVHDVCEAVASVLAPQFVAVPRGGALRETLVGFERRYGLVQVAGVVGSFHVAIGSPDDSSGQFYNTKGWHSVVLQAVVDPDVCFWDLNVGCPGSLSDSQVLVASELYERGTEGTLFPNAPRNVGGTEVPIHIVGGRSYPLLPWLMTPATEGASAADVELNRRLAAALALTRMAFGRLTSRWRCLVKCSEVDLSFLPILVTACCALHNVCEGRREACEERWLEEASEEELEQPSDMEDEDVEAEGAAEDIRSALANRVRM